MSWQCCYGEKLRIEREEMSFLGASSAARQVLCCAKARCLVILRTLCVIHDFCREGKLEDMFV